MYSYFLKLYVHYKGKQKEAAKVLFPHLHARLLSCTKGVSNCNGLLCLFYPFEEQLVFFFFLLVYDVYLYMFTSRCLYDDAGKTLSKLCPRSKSVETILQTCLAICTGAKERAAAAAGGGAFAFFDSSILWMASIILIRSSLSRHFWCC
jgi:hypothetical protein